MSMFTDVDPASAVAHGLHAVATVAIAGNQVVGVVAEADDIEVLPVATSTIVLEMMEGGAMAREAVTRLVADAMAVAESRLPNLAGCSRCWRS